jgi:hypothetical protein
MTITTNQTMRIRIGETMSVFIGGIERTPSRSDGNCSRCTQGRLERGSKPFKAKWRVSGRFVGGRVNEDDTAAEPWTKDDYDRLWKQHGSVSAMLEATGTKRVKWAEMCGHCRNRQKNGDYYGRHEEEAIR